MGRITETTTDDVMELFDDMQDQCEPLAASEVADKLDCSVGTARDRLKECEWTGDLRKKDVGTLVFWRPCETDEE